jgi:hypothetical protein
MLLKEDDVDSLISLILVPSVYNEVAILPGDLVRGRLYQWDFGLLWRRRKSEPCCGVPKMRNEMSKWRSYHINQE